MCLASCIPWFGRWRKPRRQSPLPGLSALLDLYADQASLQAAPVVWHRADFAPVRGLARGQLASEGVVEVVTDGGRSLPTRYLPDVYQAGCKRGHGGCGTTVER